MEIWKASNLLAKLAHNNQTVQTKYRNIRYAQFCIQIANGGSMIYLSIHSGKSITIEYHHKAEHKKGKIRDIVFAWLDKQQFIATKDDDASEQPSVKELPAMLNRWNRLSQLLDFYHRYDFLYRHFNQNEVVIKDWFDATCLFDDIGNDPQEDTRLYQVSLPKIARFIAHTLTNVGLFCRDIKTMPSCGHLIQIGWYTPRGCVRFPMLFGMVVGDSDLYAMLNHLLLVDQPAIVLLPSTDLIAIETMKLIKNKRFVLVGLHEFSDDDGLINLDQMSEVYQTFNLMHPETHAQQQAETFPTPPGARWQDIRIVFINNHTVRITCEVNGISISRVYDYTQMGMNNKRMALPNGQWELLLGFAEEHGQFTWANRQAHDKQKSHKHKLDQILKTFFGMTCSAFQLIHDDKGRVGYQALFVVSID